MTGNLHFGRSSRCISKFYVSTKAFALLDLSELFSVRNSVQRTTDIENKYIKISILFLSKSSFLMLEQRCVWDKESRLYARLKFQIRVKNKK